MDSQIKTGFFVCSHTGDDVLGEGSVEKPFKSIYKVKDVIREQISMGMDSDIMIYLRAGEFFINDPLVFDENDSGREGYKIYYKNFNEEKVVLTGGSSITSWKKYNKDIYVAKVEENRDFNMLYEAGKRATMARYPKMLEGKYPKEKFNLVKKTIHENKFRSLGFEEGDIPYIKNIENLQIYLWPGEEEGFCWHQNTMKVIELDYKDNTIIWNEDTGFGMGRNCRYFIQGALELLNEPGEFYLDRKNSFLYYWPFDEQNLKNGSIVIPKVDSILMVKGSSRETNASNLVFDGLTIRYSNIMDWHTYLTHGYGLVYLENANNISIVNCDINNSGWHGIQLFKYVHDNLIKGNYIHNIGHTGIQLEDLPRGGLGPYINKATTVVDNYITTVGELVGHASCMELVDSGDNLVAHNKMEYSPRYSIGMSSMSPEQLIGKVGYDGRVVNKENVKEYQHTRNNVIEYNDMSKANLDTQDTGIIETWCPGLGNIFHNNALHDSEIHFSFGTGLYLDDIADNFKVTNNVIFNLQKEGKGILGCAICAKGIGNEISNNIIADNNIAQKGGAIGTTDMSRKRENYDLRLSRNIFFNTGSCAYVFSNWDEDRYSECDFNVFYQQGEICGVRGAEGIPDFIEMKEWRVLQNRKFDGYSIEKDPKFMDAVNFDYRLRYDSPAHEVGFNEIDFEAIGLSDDFKLGDNTDELDKIFVKSKISEFRSAINISTQNNKEYALMISGRTKKGYHLSSLEEYEITFQSDHENVVIVDNRGRLTATGEGVAKINITASKGRKSKSTFLFVIVDDVFDRIEYKLPNLNMVPQEKMLIKAIGRTKYGQYIKLDGLISFSSSDDNIIQIDQEGYISAINKGRSKITLSATVDGIIETETLLIEVHERMLKSISATLHKGILGVGESSLIHISGVYKDGTLSDLAECSIEIISSDPTIVSYKEGKVFANAPGDAIIFVKLEAYGEQFEKKIKVKSFLDEGLPEGWLVKNYGASEGTASYSKDKYIVMSNGENIWFKSDDFTFLCKEINVNTSIETLSIEAKLHSLVETSVNAQAGLMIRSCDREDSSHINLRTTASGELMLAYRVNNGDYISSIAGKHITLPIELKLEKREKIITVYYREDAVSIGQNKTWIEFAKVEVNISNSYLTGLALFSNNRAVSSDAVFTDVSIISEIGEA